MIASLVREVFAPQTVWSVVTFFLSMAPARVTRYFTDLPSSTTSMVSPTSTSARSAKTAGRLPVATCGGVAALPALPGRTRS